MTNLASTFIRLAGRAAEGLNNSFRLYCDICSKETVFKLISEVAGHEVYRCQECHSMTKSYTVR